MDTEKSNLENEARSKETQGYDFYNDGVYALENNEIGKAYEYFKQSAKLSSHFKTYERLYLVCIELRKDEEATEYIKMAYSLNPHSDKTAVLYAQFLIRQNEQSNAIQILNDILARNPTYGPAKKLINTLR